MHMCAQQELKMAMKTTAADVLSETGQNHRSKGGEQRPEAEETLRESENRYRTLFDLFPMAVYSCDASGVILKFNRLAAELWGREPVLGGTGERFCGSFKVFRTDGSFMPHEECPMVDVLSGKIPEVHDAEVLVERPDGSRFYALVNIRPLKDECGNITGAINCFYDITARKQGEEMLRRNEALFSALISQAPVGVYVVDAQLRLQQVNPKARPVFSRVHPLIGRDFSEIIHILWPSRVADQIMKRFRHTLKTGAPYRSPDFAERRRDIGVKQIYEWQIQRVTLPTGEHGVVCFFSNITERKRAEGARRRLAVLTASNKKLEQEMVRRQRIQESLKKSERQQTQLLQQSYEMQEQLRNLSHQILYAQEEERKRISRELHDEIAQTLVGIDVHLKSLIREAAGDIKGLPQKIKRTQRLVARSLDVVHEFARQLRPMALDDLGLVAALQAFMKEFKERTGVQIRFTTFTSGRIKQLNNDTSTVFYRVAQEALTNVARHAQASLVEVNFEKLPGAICLKIKDNGKSFQSQNVMQSKRHTRLGLLGMRERLEMVGGSFSIESAPGNGTTVRAQIPLSYRRKEEAPRRELWQG
jgi:PAS domain S-box-containing protein